ncbi:hypothetical protein D3C80_1753460 [compost metagenome]
MGSDQWRALLAIRHTRRASGVSPCLAQVFIRCRLMVFMAISPSGAVRCPLLPKQEAGIGPTRWSQRERAKRGTKSTGEVQFAAGIVQNAIISLILSLFSPCQ